MPEPRWGNIYGEKAIEPSYHDLLRENMRLRDRVEYLEAALKDTAEREAKGKLAPTRSGLVNLLRAAPFWLSILACLALPVFLYFAAREGGLVR
jgi:hypothetical protein